MKSRAFNLTLLSTIAISIAASLPAQAQRARVFVSVNGNDSNPCTALSPCRTFQAAHDAVQAGGEIDVLDTGGYGTLTISKSISIVNPGGVVASIATASGDAAIVIIVHSSDKVSLRGLTLDGNGIGGVGILFTNGGGALEIADCVARNYTGNGLYFNPSSASTLKVTNSEFNDNGFGGISVEANASVVGSLDRVGFYNNQTNGAIVVAASATAITFTVKDSVAINNGSGFASAAYVSGATSRMIVVRSVVSNASGYGIFSGGLGSQVIVDESTIFNNAHAWQADGGGFIFSHGNNSVEFNAADFGPVTAAAALE